MEITLLPVQCCYSGSITTPSLSRPNESIDLNGGATPGRARVNVEIPQPWLPPWQSKAVVIILYIKIFLTALAGETDDLSIPCHEQRTCAATD